MSKQPIKRDFPIWRCADFFSDRNTLERAFTWEIWPRAKSIKLMGDLLIWVPDERRERKFRDPQPDDIGVLMRFLRLSNAPPEEILKFASEWGVLDLCKHMNPRTHKKLSKEDGPCEQLQFSWGDLWEPAEVWRDFARQARAILRVASELNKNKQGHFQDWRVLSPARTKELGRSMFAFEMERSALAQMVEDWLADGNVRLRFTWAGDRPLIYFNCNILGFIACQLMFAISRNQGIATCSSCGNLYPPKRRPRANQRNYCNLCGKRAAWRDAQADRRRRQRLAEE